MPRCRRTRPIFSSGTPLRSISVAAVCRRTCAPLTGVTCVGPASCGAITTDEMPFALSEWPIGSDRAQEDVIARKDGGPAFEIGGDRIPDILRQRQANLIARLARDPQRARSPTRCR